MAGAPAAPMLMLVGVAYRRLTQRAAVRERSQIGVDADDLVVYSAVSQPITPEGATGCTTDATPYAYLVAIERDIIPSGEVVVRLERGFIACPDCGRESEQVTIEMP